MGARDERRRRPTSLRPPALAAQRRSLFDTAPPSHKEGYYQWMWADELGLLGDHGIAEADPFRWSDWLNAAGTIADLEAYQNTKNLPPSGAHDGQGQRPSWRVRDAHEVRVHRRGDRLPQRADDHAASEGGREDHEGHGRWEVPR